MFFLQVLSQAATAQLGRRPKEESKRKSFFNVFLIIKGGHPQFKSAPPQLRYIADNQSIAEFRTKKKLRNCDCGPLKFDFLNSATFPSRLPVRYFLVPFPQLRMLLKVFFNQKYF
jgi:hypothetical protein